MRHFDRPAFERAFEIVKGGHWQEDPEYYPRYVSRYQAVVERYAAISSDPPLDVLEVGGGQLALLVARMWGDRAVVADVTDECFPTLAEYGVEAFKWNAARDEPPPEKDFDVILCSEVIEHLPVPGHVFLSRLRALIRPGGVVILTTPNLYRLRNIVYLSTGRRIFDRFDVPGDTPFGHVLEYSAEHLAWQFERAGFDAEVELVEFHHTPTRRSDAALSTLGRPLRMVPRFRDNLMVVASPAVSPNHRGVSAGAGDAN